MNNSFRIALETEADKLPDERLREEEARLVRLIEALAALSESPVWSTLKAEMFEGALTDIESRLHSEVIKTEVNLPRVYRLQGERIWAKRYADPVSYVDTLRTRLAHIRKQLNPGGPTP